MPEILWQPTARQSEFLSATEDEVLFGGAAGGGKSDALLIDALGGGSAISEPDYRALLIRQTFPQLRELIDRSRMLYPAAIPGSVYHERDREWRFPSGAKLVFGYCERDADVYQYQGQQFQWIGIDELGHFSSPMVWTYLSSRLRSTNARLKCYQRGTCNPGPRWIMERFGIARNGAPSKQAVEIDGHRIVRRFIPSRLQDNPHLSGTGYEQRLKLMPEAERRALLDGEWGVIAVPGAYYTEELKRVRADNRVTRVPYDPRLLVHTFWDLGVGDATAIWFVQIHGAEKRAIDYYEQNGEGLPHYASVLKGRGYNYGEHWAPHDIEVRELGSGQSRIEIAQGLGINFRVVPKLSVDDGIHAAKMVFPSCWFDAQKCARGLEALEHYRRDYNSRLGEFVARPVHDWASHGADAWRYFAVASDKTDTGRFGGKIKYKDLRVA